MEQLLFMVDWPECDSCIWRLSEEGQYEGFQFWKRDGNRSMSPVSGELLARIEAWAEAWVDGWDVDDKWASEAAHEDWLQEAWALLREVNIEVRSLGCIVRPAADDFIYPGKDSYGSRELSASEVRNLLDCLNAELRQRGLPVIPAIE